MNFSRGRVPYERPDGDQRRGSLAVGAAEPDGLGVVGAQVRRVRVEGRVLSGQVQHVLLLQGHLIVLVSTFIKLIVLVANAAAISVSVNIL